MKNKKPNIIFLVVDALRAENMGCYGYKRNTTPNIDKLASNSVLFENCFSCTTSTDPSFTSIFSGKYTLTHGIIHHGPKITDKEKKNFHSSNTKLLAEVLKSDGYNTLGIDWLGRWHKNGFDYYWGDDEEKKSIRKKIKDFGKKALKKIPLSPTIHNLLMKFLRGNKIVLPSHEAGKFTIKAIEKIKESRKKSKKPFFLLIHYWDVHTPYRIPKTFFDKFNDLPKKTKIKDKLDKIKNKKWRDHSNKFYVVPGFTYMEELEAMYNAAVNYVDSHVGELTKFLVDSDLDKDTVLIITGDHGDSVGKHFPYFDHHGFFEEMIHVPLIVKYGSNFSRKKIDSLVQHIDLVPTVLDILNINFDEYNLDGSSLLPVMEGKSQTKRNYVFLSEPLADRFMVRDERYKYIFSKDKQSAKCCFCDDIHEGDVEVLYDLVNDPGETKNIIDHKKDVYLRLKEELMAWIKRSKFNNERGKIKKVIDVDIKT